MAPQVLAKEIVNKIIYENTPFSLALKQAFKRNDISKEEKAGISAIVGCVLRHYLVMSHVIQKQYPELESLGMVALLIAFSNALFIKKFDQEACNKLPYRHDLLKRRAPQDLNRHLPISREANPLF